MIGKHLKSHAFRSVAQLIKSQLRSDSSGAMIPPTPLPALGVAHATPRGGTPAPLIRIPVPPTPYRFGDPSKTAQKKSRHWKGRQGVGGTAYV